MPPTEQQLKRYTQWAMAAGAAEGTLRLRMHHLTRLAAMFPSTPLLALDTYQLAEYLSTPGWAAETRKSARSAIRSFFSWAVDTELLPRDPSRKLPPVRVPQGKPRPTPEDVFLQALLLADDRGRLMLMLAGYVGLRRGEIAKVHTDDIADELRVCGKGGRVRTIPLHPVVAAELAKVDRHGYLFPGKDHGHLSPGHVGVLLRRLLGPGWSGHTLRHRFASRAFAVERDILAVMALLGHTKPETTMRYTAIPEGARRAAVFGV